MTYAELANKCRDIHQHVAMLAQVQGETDLEEKLKARIATDWAAIATDWAAIAQAHKDNSK